MKGTTRTRFPASFYLVKSKNFKSLYFCRDKLSRNVPILKIWCINLAKEANKLLFQENIKGTWKGVNNCNFSSEINMISQIIFGALLLATLAFANSESIQGIKNCIIL